MMVTGQGAGTGCGIKWSDSDCILKVEQTQFCVRLHVYYVRKRRIKDDSKLLGLNNWKKDGSFNH